MKAQIRFPSLAQSYEMASASHTRQLTRALRSRFSQHHSATPAANTPSLLATLGANEASRWGLCEGEAEEEGAEYGQKQASELMATEERGAMEELEIRLCGGEGDD